MPRSSIPPSSAKGSDDLTYCGLAAPPDRSSTVLAWSPHAALVAGCLGSDHDDFDLEAADALS